MLNFFIIYHAVHQIIKYNHLLKLCEVDGSRHINGVWKNNSCDERWAIIIIYYNIPI